MLSGQTFQFPVLFVLFCHYWRIFRFIYLFIISWIRWQCGQQLVTAYCIGKDIEWIVLDLISGTLLTYDWIDVVPQPQTLVSVDSLREHISFPDFPNKKVTFGVFFFILRLLLIRYLAETLLYRRLAAYRRVDRFNLQGPISYDVKILPEEELISA